MAGRDACETDWNSASGTRDLRGNSPMQDLDANLKLMGAPWGEGNYTEGPGKGLYKLLPGLQTRERSLATPHLIPVCDSPYSSIQLPSSPPLSIQLPPLVPSFDRNCAPSQALVVDHGQYDDFFSQQ